MKTDAPLRSGLWLFAATTMLGAFSSAMVKASEPDAEASSETIARAVAPGRAEAALDGLLRTVISREIQMI